MGAGKNIGVVGLGCMGIPMSLNLKNNGYNVQAFDIVPEARKVANENGIATTESLAELSKD